MALSKAKRGARKAAETRRNYRVKQEEIESTAVTADVSGDQSPTAVKKKTSVPATRTSSRLRPKPDRLVISRQSKRSCRLLDYLVTQSSSTRRDGEKSEVKAIRYATNMPGGIRYGIRWSDNSNTEEHWEMLIPGSEEAIVNFHRRYPEAPRPSHKLRSILGLYQLAVGDELPNDDEPDSETIQRSDTFQAVCRRRDIQPPVQTSEVTDNEQVIRRPTQDDSLVKENRKLRITSTRDARTIQDLRSKVRELQSRSGNDHRLDILRDQILRDAQAIKDLDTQARNLVSQKMADVKTIERLRSELEDVQAQPLHAQRLSDIETINNMHQNVRDLNTQNFSVRHAKDVETIAGLREQVKRLETENAGLQADLARIQGAVVSWGYVGTSAIAVE